MMPEYVSLLSNKQKLHTESGFEAGELPAGLFDYQADIVRWATKKGKACIFAGTGLGKCHGAGTPILMYNGVIKNVEEIKPGDLLMGPDSKPRRVLSIASGKDELFEIVPIKGESFVCNSSHVLSLKITADKNKYRKNQIINIPLDEYLRKNKTFKHIAKLWRTGVSFKSDEVQYDPYIVGVWLGDGSKSGPDITNSDFEIQEALFDFAKQNNLKIRKVDANNTITHCLSHGRNNQHGKKNVLRELSRDCVVFGEKRIPFEYLVNDEITRLQVLAGLLDTDGYLIDNVYEITTKYDGLKDDILFLARSLGFHADSRLKRAEIKSSGFSNLYHRIFISGETSRIPCKVERKIATTRKQKKDVLKTGFSVRSVGWGKYYGFTLDKDGLYLLGDFTVTHNTAMQLSWAEQVENATGGNVLIICPLAVAAQTVQEGKMFGINVTHCRTMDDVKPGINITNYERLHLFKPEEFSGIVLDESSILKNYNGTIRNQICEMFHDTPYRLCCSATPSPNDHTELGNHAEFLGIMKMQEMLATFFLHDGGDTSVWRLKRHAVKEFWQWVASWAVMLQNPRDLGYDGSRFDLPALNIEQITVEPKETAFFYSKAKSLSERRTARKESIAERVAAAAELVNKSKEPWIVWCDLNNESKALTDAIPDAVEIEGAHKPEYKENEMNKFSSGDTRVLVTKPLIAGWGLNWQHCHNMAFVGLSDSFEMVYQAIRRCWRFGQTKPVNVYFITSKHEGEVVRNIKHKEKLFQEMLSGMIAATQELCSDNIRGTTNNQDYNPAVSMKLPAFIGGVEA